MRLDNYQLQFADQYDAIPSNATQQLPVPLQVWSSPTAQWGSALYGMNIFWPKKKIFTFIGFENYSVSKINTSIFKVNISPNFNKNANTFNCPILQLVGFQIKSLSTVLSNRLKSVTENDSSEVNLAAPGRQTVKLQPHFWIEILSKAMDKLEFPIKSSAIPFNFQ